MLFNSLEFLYLFLPITYFVFWRLRTRSARYVWLAVTGYVFYSMWSPRFCLLMAASTLVSFGAGLGFARTSDPRRRKILLVAPIVFDLSLLAFFKYTNFLVETANELSRALGSHRALPTLDVVLPVGISFYTFHTITYVVDCYRGVVRPTRNLFEFACYVSLFAQLVAGPIVRFREIEKDLDHIDVADRGRGLQLGWSYFAIGLIKKVLVADTIAAVIDPALADESAFGSTVGAWLCALGYAYQLYFDFSGYSDMAVGLGHLFGLKLPQNFDSPYKAIDVADFWRRWHVSLSSFLRDYLYVPLGGSRGSRFLTYRNLMITMLLGGLWHGASWTFVAWGAYHGVLLSLNRAFEPQVGRIPAPLRRALTFLLVIVGWVFFRSPTFALAFRQLAVMFTWRAEPLFPGWAVLLGMLAVSASIAHRAPNAFELSHRWSPARAAGMVVLFLVCLLLIYGGRQSPFLYFQF